MFQVNSVRKACRDVKGFDLLVLRVVLDCVVVAAAAGEVDGVLHQVLLVNCCCVNHRKGRLIHWALQRPPYLHPATQSSAAVSRVKEGLVWVKRLLYTTYIYELSNSSRVRYCLSKSHLNGCKGRLLEALRFLLRHQCVQALCA